nr:ATP synthase F0 subunit 8 [Aristosyrphus sp.]
MPQMFPMNWLFLFMIFSLTLIMFSIMNYFNYMPYISKKQLNLIFLKKTMNWKW